MIQPIGYLKLHRDLYHKPIWLQSTPEQKVILMTLLAMAWFKPNEWEWKGHKFRTVEGQFVTSLESIANDSGKGISTQNVRTALKRFEKLDFLTNESTKQGRLVTIVNWGFYQSQEDKLTNELTVDQQTPNKRLTPKEEGKKGTRKEKDFLPDSKEYRASNYLFEKILDRNPSNRKPDINSWALHIDYMIRIDNRTPKQIADVIDWSQQDDFWQNNILSTKSLRRNYDQMFMKMNEGVHIKTNAEQKALDAKLLLIQKRLNDGD